MYTCIKAFGIALGLAVLTGCKKDDQLVTPSHSSLNTASVPPPEFSTSTARINSAFRGYYTSLPGNYAKSGEKYPLLIFFHGLGQRGDGVADLPKLGEYGIGQLLKDKQFPASFTVKGKSHQFIVVAPQYHGDPTAAEARSLVNFFQKKFRVDPSRIYLAGLSAGGMLLSELAASDPKKFAAIVPIAGVTKNSVETKTRAIANASLPVWLFHNAEDDMVDAAVSRSFFETLTGFKPAIAPRLTIFNRTGHDAWTSALNPSYKENELNIYEWMLQYSS